MIGKEKQEDFRNNLAFFVCPNCKEEIIITVNKASIVRTLNPHWMDKKAKVVPVIDGKNHSCLFSSDFDLYIRNYIKRKLKNSHGKISNAAKKAGITKERFYKYMKKFDLIEYAKKLREENNKLVRLNIAKAYKDFRNVPEL